MTIFRKAIYTPNRTACAIGGALLAAKVACSRPRGACLSATVEAQRARRGIVAVGGNSAL